MNFRRGRQKRPPTVLDMTPLVDVVFQLLIFFLLTSTYVQVERASSTSVPVELPESSLSANDQLPEEIIVSVNQNGEVFYGDDAVTLEELAIRLVRTANSNPKSIVLVRGDQRVPYGRIGQVMSIVRASGLRMSALLESGD
jgi:biopolymer transport protein TolR